VSQSSSKQVSVQGYAGQGSLSFIQLDAEIDLATALHAKTGRDLFAGVTGREDRQAAARIAIVMNRLEGEFGEAYQRIYGEAIPGRVRIKQNIETRKGK
jgi:hypothetical protein